MIFLVLLQTVQKRLFLFLCIPALCLAVLFSAHSYQLVITLAIPSHFLWCKLISSPFLSLLPGVVHPLQKSTKLLAPAVSCLLCVFSKISFQMHIAFTVASAEMIQGCFVVMGQDTCIFFQDPHTFKRLQILLFTSYIQYVRFCTEISNVRLLPVCFYCGRIRTELMSIQKVFFYLPAYLGAGFPEFLTEAVYAAFGKAQRVPHIELINSQIRSLATTPSL